MLHARFVVLSESLRSRLAVQLSNFQFSDWKSHKKWQRQFDLGWKVGRLLWELPPSFSARFVGSPFFGVRGLVFPSRGWRLACLSSGVNLSCHFGVGFGPSFLGFGLALISRGVVVGLLEVVFCSCLSWLGLAFLAVEGCAIPPRVGGGVGEGGCSFLLDVCPSSGGDFDVGGWPFLLVVVVWAFLPAVRAGLPSRFWGWPFFLLVVRVRPPFLEWWLALPSWGWVWPVLLLVGACLSFSGGNWLFLLAVVERFAILSWSRGVGPSWTWPSGFVFGPSFSRCGGWPFLLGRCSFVLRSGG